MNRVESDFRVPASHPSFPGHFPGRPIVPGVLLLDHVIEILVQATGRSAACVQDAKFMLPVQPDEEAHVSCQLDGNHVTFRVSVRREGASVTVAAGNLLLHADTGQSA